MEDGRGQGGGEHRRRRRRRRRSRLNITSTSSSQFMTSTLHPFKWLHDSSSFLSSLPFIAFSLVSLVSFPFLSFYFHFNSYIKAPSLCTPLFPFTTTSFLIYLILHFSLLFPPLSYFYLSNLFQFHTFLFNLPLSRFVNIFCPDRKPKPFSKYGN